MKIQVEGHINGTINFAMQQNYVPIVRNLILRNSSEKDLINLKLKISFNPEFARTYETTIEKLVVDDAVEITPIKIVLSPDYLLSLTEKLVANIHIEIFENDESIYSYDNDIELLAYDEWTGLLLMPEIVSAFVTPNHPKVSEIISDASLILKEWTGDPSFTGYQTQNINEVKKQMGAIYAALQKSNIAYNMPPASYELIGQRVRLPHIVLEQKCGTCLDLSILYASCLEAVGLNPILIFINGHAFAGCWLEENTFSECTTDDVSALTKRIADGIEEICLTECTDYVAGRSVSFDIAEKHAKDNLINQEDFILVVDVMRSRGSGIRPMPMRVLENGSYKLIDYGERKNEEITSVPSQIDTTIHGIVAKEQKMTKQKIWERKLLDLSLRNTLLNFRATKSAVQLMTSNLAQLEDELADGEDFKIMSRPSDWVNSLRDTKIYEIENEKDLIQAIATSEFKSKRIRSFLDDDELEKSMKNLHRQSKISIEENGTNTLYLALGFLKWYESDLSQKVRYAPLVLIPIDIKRKVQQKAYAIRIRDEETQMNITLLEMLKQDFGININGLDPLPTDSSGVDLKLVFNTVRKNIMSKKGWDVEEFAFMGLFSFSQFIMWNDIRNRSEDLKKNKVVSSLMSGKMQWVPVTECLKAQNLDNSISPVDMVIPTSADSSQIVAISTAAKGQSFVLHGPPGTGKSQTITNIIANTLYQGKTVLFVAEKMAALSVVQKRLAAIGLDPFCLELHSNKAQKRSVLNQLDKTLNVGHIKEPEEYEETARKLHNMRKELNEVMEEIHKKRSYGMSLYEAISKYESTIQYKGKLIFDKNTVEMVKENTYFEWYDCITKLRTAGLECGCIKNSCFKLFQNREYSLESRENLREVIERYIEMLKTVKDKVENIVSKFEMELDGSFKSIINLKELSKELLESEILLKPILDNNEFGMQDDEIRKILNIGISKNILEKELLQQFESTIYDYDVKRALIEWKQAEESWFLPKRIKQNKLLKELKVYSKNVSDINKDTAINIYNKLITYSENCKYISQVDLSISNKFQGLWVGVNSNWDILNKAYNDTCKVRNTINNIKITDISVFLSNITEIMKNKNNCKNNLHEEINEFNMCLDKCLELEKELEEKYLVRVYKIRKEKKWIDCNLKNLEIWRNNIDNLKAWTSLLVQLDLVKSAGMNNVVEAYVNGDISEEDIVERYECNLNFALVMKTISETKSLSEFQGAQFEETISKYMDVTKEFEVLSIKELVAKLSSKIPNTSFSSASSSDIGILKKAISSGGRMLSIRKLFDNIPTLLRRICPCMLMSPISVAQYIDPSFPKFDLVIFDEASQLPTCEAVGAIARGENVIVVGDPKQLPPTSFFSSNRVDEENYYMEDLESVLDDCLALTMPQEHLLWHYRSRHESLIAYSNAKFYDNKLFTFPSPNDLVSAVRLVHVDGFYDKGNTRQNMAEAKAITEEIIKRLSDKELQKNSIGVVTFSVAQQNLIDDLLSEAFTKNPKLEKINDDSEEPIIIKNLENVQGDERDVILFSIGYGPDKNGKVSMNFGPLNNEGGWRRLNVAISRARKKMIVYSTIKPEQIDLSRTRSEGVAGLKGFLEFAERGKNVLVNHSKGFSNNNKSIEFIIADRLKKLGYETRCNIGCSEYKIDIGVVNPKKTDEYIIGIMCDGDSYKMSNTCRDRNILQPNILSGLGWNIYRVWVLDWLDNPDKVLEKIKMTIEKALLDMKVNPTKKSEKDFRTIEFEKTREDEKINDYQRVYTRSKFHSEELRESFYESTSINKIQNCIREVIKNEAPISRKLLGKRVLAVWGITRSGSRVDSILEEILKGMSLKTSKSNGTIFYWREDQDPKAYFNYRVAEKDDDKRSMDDVCSEEIANGIKVIMDNQVSISQEDLIKETAKMFGFTRMGNIIETSVIGGIEEANKRGDIEISRDGKIKLID